MRLTTKVCHIHAMVVLRTSIVRVVVHIMNMDAALIPVLLQYMVDTGLQVIGPLTQLYQTLLVLIRYLFDVRLHHSAFL